MTISTPLAHAYLLSGDPHACVETVRERLTDIYADRKEALEIDPGVVETFTVDMARELSQRGQQRAEGEARCSIRGFQLMTRPAQNALLKTLEEPAAGVHFFLITPTPNHLLETVRSRTTESDLCSHTDDKVVELVGEFMQANDLPARLAVAETVVEEDILVGFIAGLAGAVDEDDLPLQDALRTVAPWLQESSRSDKQIAEFLAISASQKK